MLDPDHEVFYRKDDGTIASVAEVIADPNLVARTADSHGRDPVGSLATKMAQLYVEIWSGIILHSTGSAFSQLPHLRISCSDRTRA